MDVCIRITAHCLLTALLLSCAAAPSGCSQLPGPIQSMHDSHVVLLPGISGTRSELSDMEDLINSEVVATSAQIWDWTCIEPTFVFRNLTDNARNRRRALVLAHELRAWRQRHPYGKLYLCGFSGGVGIACLTSEVMDTEPIFERVVLISGAVSPYYDLGLLLGQARKGVYNYYSPHDWWRICDGTRYLGTVDKFWGASCGHVGFIYPHDAPGACKLRQLAWRPEMREMDNEGKHFDAFARTFARAYLLPLFAEDIGAIPQEWR